MGKLTERHEVVAEADGRTFVFLAEPDQGRLSIREVDPEGEQELCGLTLSDQDEIESFFAGLHRVLQTAGVARGGFPGLEEPPTPAKRLTDRPTRSDESRSQDDRREVVERSRHKNVRAFSPWSPEEEREVETRYRAGDSLDAIARSRGRSRRAIEMRLQKMGVIEGDPPG